ncbi:MAG: LCP family protein [Acidimicrobiales bacterium]
MSPRPVGGRLRRTWPQRLLICFNVVCIVVALTGAGMVAYAKKTVAQIPRISLDRGTITPVEDLPPGEPQNFLIVGVDSDENLPADDRVRDGRDSGPEKAVGQRSDTIMVVRIDPGQTQARILSFPRDLWVQIPGHGKQKINAAMAYGADSGPSLLMATIKANFDIDINHYVQVDFAAFKNIVALIGGVKVYLNAPVRDGHSGLYQPNAGCSLLDADQALAYARSRYLQYQDERGRWRSDPGSDLSRITRQQYFVRKVLSRAIEKGARNPVTLTRMVDTATGKGIALDPFTTPQDLINLGRTFKDFDPQTLRTDTLPVVDATRGGADVLLLIEDEAEPILAQYRGTGTAGAASSVDPSSVSVRVINGTGTLNQGADTTDRLASVGFLVSSPGADAVDQPLRTEVRYHPGKEGDALLVARYLAADPVLIADDGVDQVTVVTGPDFFGVADEPRPAEALAGATSTTTSTVPEATTSTSTTEVATVDPSASTTSTTVPAEEPYLPGTPPPGESCG